MPIRTVELFAGVGGFRCGLEAASPRFDTVWANQWEPSKKAQHAFECYVRRFGESQGHVNADIGMVRGEIPEHDLLVGGFPCQDYSVARTNASGMEGKKGVLWWEIDGIVEARRPSYILLENVDRLLKSPTKQRGRDFAVILRCLHDKGYAVEWRVINAAEYGHPQKRRRVFIFAFRDGTPFHGVLAGKQDMRRWLDGDGFFADPFPVEAVGKVDESDVVDGYESLADISDSFGFAFANAGVMKDGRIFTAKTSPVPFIPDEGQRGHLLGHVLENDGVDEKYYINGALDKWTYMKGSKREPRVRPNGEEYFYTEGAIPFPDPADSPARTLLTSESSKNRSTHVVEDPASGRLRLLTPLECERLNGFPDGWTDSGMPEKARYFMMGNALVVPLVTRMGRRLLEIVSED